MDEIVKDENLEEIKQDEEVKEETKKTETKPEEVKKYSDKDVDEIINKKFAKWQKDQEEEKRLSKLSADERAKEESKKKDEEIERLRAEIDRNNLEKDTVDRLTEEGLPLTFKSFLMGKNAEDTNDAIKSFKEIYQKAIQEEVEKRFKGHTPKASTSEQTKDVWSRVNERYKK